MEQLEGYPLPDWFGKFDRSPGFAPAVAAALVLALPCGGVSGISAFLRELTLEVQIPYFFDLDRSLYGPLRAMHGAAADSFVLGPHGQLGAYFFIIEMVVGHDDADPSASESHYEAWLQYLRGAPTFLNILHPGTATIDYHHLPGRMRMNLVAYKLTLRNAGKAEWVIAMASDAEQSSLLESLEKRWFLISEPQAARAKDILGLADVLRSDQSTECQQAEGLEVCGLGLRPSDGVWWRGPIKQTPKAGAVAAIVDRGVVAKRRAVWDRGVVLHRAGLGGDAGHDVLDVVEVVLPFSRRANLGRRSTESTESNRACRWSNRALSTSWGARGVGDINVKMVEGSCRLWSTGSRVFIGTSSGEKVESSAAEFATGTWNVDVVVTGRFPGNRNSHDEGKVGAAEALSLELSAKGSVHNNSVPKSSQSELTRDSRGELIQRTLQGDMGEPGNAYNGQIRDGLFHGRGTLIYAGNERYEGDWVYGKREGHGRFTYQDGAIFEGNWQEDRIHGQGVAVFASGNRYEGMWENGRIHGHGSLTYSNKDQYEGEWHDGKMHGRGTYKYAEGDVYQGEWKDDKRHGKGVVTYVSARGSVVEKFEGDWVNGKMHGQGKYQYADGGVYEGDWQDGKMHGRGIYVFPNGNTYDGEWVNDMKEGYGTLTYQNGEKYDGYWKQDKVHGQGTLVYTYGDKFIGQWVDAKKEGEGELIYSNGDRFKGQWVDDRASGHGLFQYSNGNRYEGQWLDDKRHGRGLFACAEDGSVYDGEFAYGRKDGRGLLKLQSGHVLSGQWKQGELVQVADFVFAADSPWKNPDL
ncbi:Radial spoke head 10 homolog B [Durusdinium trenchii]|uniref:Radial spoke head 10 homolog B n=2 Tax=Durusdinium trenchii TaxID=1381693 RepID=A0ABP0SLT8_9DINO